MTVREAMIEILMDEGYGFIEANTAASKCIKEARERGPGEYTYNTKEGRSVTFQVKESD